MKLFYLNSNSNNIQTVTIEDVYKLADDVKILLYIDNKVSAVEKQTAIKYLEVYNILVG